MTRARDPPQCGAQLLTGRAPRVSSGQSLTLEGYPFLRALIRMSAWVRTIKLGFRKWRRRRESCSEVTDIPNDWQNTLAKKRPALQRSSSSVSSFTSSSSSYSVNDFLHDLATSEELISGEESRNVLTSTPFTCAAPSLPRILAGREICDDIRGVEEGSRRQKCQFDQNLYENAEFLREMADHCSVEDVDDGYETILVNNQLSQNCNNCFQSFKFANK